LLRRRTARRTRFYSVRWIVGLLAFTLAVVSELVIVTLTATVKMPPSDGSVRVAFVTLIAVSMLLPLGIAALFLSMLRPVTVTRAAMRIPSGLRTVVVPIDDIAGVGLLYCKDRPGKRSPSAWYVVLWRRDGTMQRAANLLCRRAADALPIQIGASRAAKIARRLDGKIRTVQGPAGALATLELQKHVRDGFAGGPVAFWSPDGDTYPAR
jgi:hypothetical protein